jgi:hypothetical protein
MSEPQTETDVEPTPGPWELDEIAPSGLMKPIFVESGDATICAMAAFLEPNSHVDPKEALANARLIAAAGTAAQEAREMGYKPVATMKALPQILSQIESLLQGEYEHEGVIFPGTMDLLRELGGSPLEKDALDNAEGSDE